MKNVLVHCTDNSCRSQMAEGYLTHFADEKATIYSAGTKAREVDPAAVAIMKLDGIDISRQTTNSLTDFTHIHFDFIITVCDQAKENLPFETQHNTKRIHQHFFDPLQVSGSEEQIFNAYKSVRNQIKVFCKEFVETELE